MPFTVAHAAAVLPFRKLNLVWSAFIVGSMAPDFPYVIGTIKYREMGHFYPGVVFFTIPASLVALWLFHNVIKEPVIGLLPAGMQIRLRKQMGKFRFDGPLRFLAIVVSIALGIMTHLLWDSFTHPFTWAFYHFTWLRSWVRVPFVGAMPMHSVLQYVSSIGGLLALAIWVLLWYRRSTPPVHAADRPQPRSRWALALAMFVAAGVAALVRAFLVVGTPATRHNADKFLLVLGVTALALAFWELVLYCVLIATHQVWMLP